MRNYTKAVFIKGGMFVVFMALLAGPLNALASVNIVPNANLETPSSGDPNMPDQWAKGIDSVGNTVTYTYPVTDAPVSDVSSGNAAKIVATTIIPGTDAKWYFTPVPVVAGERYAFSDSYIATTDTDLVAAYCTDIFLSNCIYDASQSAPATPTDTWKQSTASFIVPAGKTYMTVFHRIQASGTLIVDNYNLMLVPPSSPFAFPFISLAFDDGLASQFNNALPVLLTGNAKGTFFIPTHFISGFSIINPSLENSSGGNPTDWIHSGGSSSATFTYSSDAHTGAGAGEVADTVADGNAAWSFTSTTIIPDTIYSFQEYYKSTANSKLVAQVTMNDNTVINADVVDSAGVTLGSSVSLPPAANYTATQAYFYMPLNAKSVTILNQLTGIGSLTIDDVSLGREGYMTSDQVLTLQADGNEIGGHTQTHPDLTTVTTDVMNNEINGGRLDLLNNGVTSVLSFAYPYGGHNQAIQEELTSAGYTSGRTVLPSGFNDLATSKLVLFSQSVGADTTLSQLENWISEAKANNGWLILTFHDIQNDLTGIPYGTTPQNLADIITYINGQDIPIKTISEGVALMGSSVPPPPPPPPPPPDITPPVVIPPVPASGSSGYRIKPLNPTVTIAPQTGQVLGAEKFIFTLFSKMGPPYKMSIQGNEVMELQKFLNTTGYGPLIVDGKFGLETKIAVTKFQTDNGLKGDGIVGDLTRAVLNR